MARLQWEEERKDSERLRVMTDLQTGMYLFFYEEILCEVGDVILSDYAPNSDFRCVVRNTILRDGILHGEHA